MRRSKGRARRAHTDVEDIESGGSCSDAGPVEIREEAVRHSPFEQYPRREKKRRVGSATRSAWRRKTIEKEAETMSAKIAGYEDADLQREKEVLDVALHSKAQAKEDAVIRDSFKAVDSFEGRTYSFVEDTPIFSSTLSGKLVVSVLTVFSFLFSIGRGSRASNAISGNLSTILIEWITLICSRRYSVVVFGALMWCCAKLVDAASVSVLRRVRHRYTVGQITLDEEHPSSRPVAQRLTDSEYSTPLMCKIWHRSRSSIQFKPFAAYDGVGFNYLPEWFSGVTTLNVSLEILMQMIVPKNTAIESSDTVLANSLTATLKALHCVPVNRISNAADNIYEETKVAAFGLIKSSKEKLRDVPFPRAVN